MPYWLWFGRRTRRSRPTAATPVPLSEGKGPAAPSASGPVATDPQEPARRRPGRRSSRRSKRRGSTESASASRSRDKEKDLAVASRLQRAQHPMAEPAQLSSGSITALPAAQPLGTSPHLRPAGSRDPADMQYNLAPNAHPHTPSRSHASLPPTAKDRGKLQKRRSDDTTPRRKSTKKRKDDHVREEEIRAMSVPAALKRPAPHSGSMTRRDTKKIRSGFNRTSDVSVHMGDSIQSSTSGGEEYLSSSFRVSSLDIFAPRPTIRYSGNGPYRHSPVERDESRADSTRRRSPISKDTLKESKTIDDLADDMDAGTLRELMERDQRRRERKQKSEEEHMRRKLERRAEKQREKEQRRERKATEKADAELDAAMGLGIGGGGPVQHGTDHAETHVDHQPSAGRDVHVDTSSPQPPPTPVETTHSPVQTPVEEPVVATAQAVRYAPTMSPPISPVHQHARGPSNVSELPELTQEVTSTGPSTISRNSSLSRRRSSEVSRRGGWSSFFRRRPSALNKKRSTDQATSVTAPSEVSFSNTSRESMARQALPPLLVPQPVRRKSGTPVRTQSKFREDLPERMPLSPPDSRVQSPEVSSARAIAARRGLNETPDPHDERESGEAHESLDEGVGKLRTDSPVSPAGRKSALMSRSLASVDSEGSWLSGKPVKRGSKGVHSSYGSGTVQRPREEFSASYEELGIPDDEYFRRLTPGPEDQPTYHEPSRKASSGALAANVEAGAEEDFEESQSNPEEFVVQSSIVRRPTVVHHHDAHAKSQEGLLSFFQAGEEGSVADASFGEEMQGVEPTTPPNDNSETPSAENSPDMTVHRASSINLSGNHVRHLSAGSAKLLDIKSGRSSVDAKRASNVSQLSESLSAE